MYTKRRVNTTGSPSIRKPARLAFDRMLKRPRAREIAHHWALPGNLPNPIMAICKPSPSHPCRRATRQRLCSGRLANSRSVAGQAASCAAIALARADCDGGTPDIIEAADEAVHLAERVPKPQLLPQAKCVLGSALQWAGDFEQSSHHLCKSLEMARELHIGYFIGQNLFFLGHRSLSRGRISRRH
jgi:hypothetical protein